MNGHCLWAGKWVRLAGRESQQAVKGLRARSSYSEWRGDQRCSLPRAEGVLEGARATEAQTHTLDTAMTTGLSTPDRVVDQVLDHCFHPSSPENHLGFFKKHQYPSPTLG